MVSAGAWNFWAQVTVNVAWHRNHILAMASARCIVPVPKESKDFVSSEKRCEGRHHDGPFQGWST